MKQYIQKNKFSFSKKKEIIMLLFTIQLSILSIFMAFLALNFLHFCYLLPGLIYSNIQMKLEHYKMSKIHSEEYMKKFDDDVHQLLLQKRQERKDKSKSWSDYFFLFKGISVYNKA